MMFLAILFILTVTFFIGYYTGKSVQDEIVPSRKYLEYGIDALLLIMLGILLFSYRPWLGVIPVVLAFFRRYLPLITAALSGVLLGLATLLPAEKQLIIFTLCLVMNFLLGATTKRLKLVWWQPAAALVIYITLSFL